MVSSASGLSPTRPASLLQQALASGRPLPPPLPSPRPLTLRPRSPPSSPQKREGHHFHSSPAKRHATDKRSSLGAIVGLTLVSPSQTSPLSPSDFHSATPSPSFASQSVLLSLSSLSPLTVFTLVTLLPDAPRLSFIDPPQRFFVGAGMASQPLSSSATSSPTRPGLVKNFTRTLGTKSPAILSDFAYLFCRYLSVPFPTPKLRGVLRKFLGFGVPRIRPSRGLSRIPTPTSDAEMSDAAAPAAAAAAAPTQGTSGTLASPTPAPPAFGEAVFSPAVPATLVGDDRTRMHGP